MKNSLKLAISAAALATMATSAFAESYQVNSVDGTLGISITVQGAGTATVAKPAPVKPTDTMAAKQNLTLNSDGTMTGSIFLDPTDPEVPNQTLFNLTGAWYRPEGSKVIYYAVDGDPTKGAASDGTYGGLFDPAKAAMVHLQGFMPMLFPTKIAAVNPIFPTVGQKTGLIKLKLNKDGSIASATTSMVIQGRAMVNYCKVDKSTDDCSIPNGTKDASFSFSVSSKATVVESTNLP